MKKIIFLGILVMSFSQNIYSAPEVRTSINFTWKENLMRAAKKFAAFIFASKHVHGAAIGVGSTLLIDIAISAIIEKQQGVGFLLGRRSPKPPTSIILLALAAAYGSYLSAYPPEKTSDLFIHSAVAGAITGTAYLVWRLIRERTSDNIEICTLKNNIKGCSKHALLNTIAILISYFSTQQLSKLNY
jgi:hypothetical protein